MTIPILSATSALAGLQSVVSAAQGAASILTGQKLPSSSANSTAATTAQTSSASSQFASSTLASLISTQTGQSGAAGALHSHHHHHGKSSGSSDDNSSASFSNSTSIAAPTPSGDPASTGLSAGSLLQGLASVALSI